MRPRDVSLRPRLAPAAPGRTGASRTGSCGGFFAPPPPSPGPPARPPGRAMEAYLKAALAFLKAHPGVRDVQGASAAGLPEAALAEWERAHAPHRLPADLRQLLLGMDGFRVTWSAAFRGASQPLGEMALHPLGRIRRVAVACAPGDDLMLDAAFLGRRSGTPNAGKAPLAAFELDATPHGRVALWYFAPGGSPEIWFQDLGAEWNYICSHFTDYFKIMMLHLGLPRWQYVFSAVGLDPDAAQWHRYFAPDCLVVDVKRGLMHRKDRATAALQDDKVTLRADPRGAAAGRGGKGGGGLTDNQRISAKHKLQIWSTTNL